LLRTLLGVEGPHARHKQKSRIIQERFQETSYGSDTPTDQREGAFSVFIDARP
jgi:hypothetical protein